MFDAMAAMTFFFKTSKEGRVKDFLLEWSGREETAKLSLGDNEAKAKSLEIYVRTPWSNMTQPKEFWNNIDRELKDAKDGVVRKWDLHCRPQLAHLAHAGVVSPGHFPNPCGHAVATAEPGQEPYITIDYRVSVEKSQGCTRCGLISLRTHHRLEGHPIAEDIADHFFLTVGNGGLLESVKNGHPPRPSQDPFAASGAVFRKETRERLLLHSQDMDASCVLSSHACK